MLKIDKILVAVIIKYLFLQLDFSSVSDILEKCWVNYYCDSETNLSDNASFYWPAFRRLSL